MSRSAELLFEYLGDVIYRPASAKLNIEALDEDFRDLGEGLLYFAQCLDELRRLAKALSKGDLDAPLPSPGNELAAPLKSLHASLRHMTWQSQQVAKGDYRQRIDFMGHFAEAFNTMVEQLEARQRALEMEIERGQEKARALEQSSSLLTSITSNIPQIIVVFGEDRRTILYQNNSAAEAFEADPTLVGKLLRFVERTGSAGEENAELFYKKGSEICYLSLRPYSLQWNGQSAKAVVLSDVSEEKEHVRELEFHAYRDNLTNLHNRYYGMRALEEWIEGQRHFCLCFADLDNLKYVNDTFGHSEGDIYIQESALRLREFCPGCVTCRLGGDEFMVLVPDYNLAEAQARMGEVYDDVLKSSEEKPYSCHISYGIVEVLPDDTRTASAILSTADELMYKFKRERKKARVQ